jgi:hypothetical protein
LLLILEGDLLHSTDFALLTNYSVLQQLNDLVHALTYHRVGDLLVKLINKKGQLTFLLILFVMAVLLALLDRVISSWLNCFAE